MVKSQPTTINNTKQPSVPPPAKVAPQAVKGVNQKNKEVNDEIAEIESGEKASLLKPGILLKAAILAIVNLVAVAVIVFLIGQLQIKAQEVKRLRSLKLSAASNKDPFTALSKDIAESQAKTDELTSYFADSEGLVTFVGEIDKLKGEGRVTNFSFANEVPIRDKTKALGFPVLIELRGIWPEIDNALGRIMSLPYFVRAIRVEAQTSQEDANLVDFKFGGFLYVE